MATGNENSIVPTTANIPGRAKDYQNFLAGQLMTGDGSKNFGRSVFTDGKGIVGDAQKFAEKIRNVATTKIQNLEANVGNIPSSPPQVGPPGNAPTFDSIKIPDPPDIDYGYATNIEFPNLEHINPPINTTLPGSADVPTDILNQLKAEFSEGLDPEGYSPSVEQAIYDRARTRREADLKAKKEEAASQFARRGFPAPPGALHALNMRYDIEAHREETDLNRDIIKQQADLIRQRYERILDLGQQLFQMQLSKEELESRTDLDRATKQYQFALDSFSSEIRKAEAQGTLAQAEVQYLTSRMQIEQVRVEAYRSQVQGKQAKADTQRAEAEAYAALASAKGSIGRVQADQYKAEADVEISKNNVRQQASSDAASVAAQLASSAITAVNASVQLSGSQSDRASTDYQMSIGRQDGYYINENVSSSS